MKRKLFLLFLLSLCITVFTSTLFAGVEPSPFRAETNKLNAVYNALGAIDMQLEVVFMKHQPKGIIGSLDSIAVQLETQKKRMMTSLSNLPHVAGSIPYQIENAVESIGNMSVQIAERARVGFQLPPDDQDVLEALDKLIPLAENISINAHDYLAFLWDKLIPIRFVQVTNCYPWICEPPLDYDSLLAAVVGANETFREAGLHFVIKSVEQYYMYHFANETFPVDSNINWDDAKAELEQVFPISEPTIIPYEQKHKDWVHYMSTVFSDRTELLVWVFGYDSLVSRQIEHHSESSFPNGGRSLIISAQNINDPHRPYPTDPQLAQPALSPYHLAHELGHFFGIRHVWDGPSGINPYTGSTVDWPDLWDLIFCPGNLGFPLSFDSMEEAEQADCSFYVIHKADSQNCLVDNRYGADDSDMECTMSFAGPQYNYYSGDSLMKGLSFDLGAIEDSPSDVEDDTYSFAWGLNVMGYYSNYKAHLWTPGRFSVSQLDLIWGHANHSVPIADSSGFYLPYGVWPYDTLYSDRNLLGTN